MIRVRISRSVAAPFSSPNASHASEHGKIVECTNQPPPTMKFRGAWSLNRKSSPGLSARNVRSDGDQKLTSVKCGSARRWSNQSPSVTATTNLTPMDPPDSECEDRAVSTSREYPGYLSRRATPFPVRQKGRNEGSGARCCSMHGRRIALASRLVQEPPQMSVLI